MSVDLKPIVGRTEKPSSKTIAYEESEMFVTLFFGGKENGQMLQVSLSADHIQFT